MSLASLALAPELVWGLLPRLLGVVFLISFLSLSRQAVPIAGMNGVLPFALRRRHYFRGMPTWRVWTSFPSLLLLRPSDGFLRGTVWAGIVGALGAIHGGPIGALGLAACYLAYVSLDKPLGLIFPWDCVLFEAAFLGLLLPHWPSLPDLSVTTLPNPWLVWCFRLLVLRVVLGFGKLKFLGSNRRDAAYLSGFLTNQPLPTPLGWYLQKAPVPLLRAALGLLFVIEVPLPLLILDPQLGVVAAVGIAALMLGIWLTGTFGYFNLIMLVLCFTLLDTETPATLADKVWAFGSGADGAAPGALFVSSVCVLQLLGGLLAFPFSSWVGQHWHHWPILLRLPPWLAWPFAFYRALHPLRWVHPYGVFPPKTQPCTKVVPVVEISWNGQDWEELSYPLACSRPESRPRFLAPHHARGDQAVIYEAFGLNSVSMINGLTLPGDPFLFTDHSGARALLQRLLEGRQYPGVYLQHHPRITPETPPRWARIRCFALEPTSLTEKRTTGHFWRRRYLGPHLPPVQRDPAFWDNWLAEPELFHWEHHYWRQRSYLGRLQALARRGIATSDLVARAAPDLATTDLRIFWTELLPFVRSFASEWRDLDAFGERLQQRFSSRELRALERVLGLLSAIGMAQVEPLYVGRWRPTLRARSYGELWLGLQQLILSGGEAAFEALRREPQRLNIELSQLSHDRALWLSATFRADALRFEASKLRLIHSFAHACHTPLDRRGQARAERSERFARQLSVFVDIARFLRETVPGPGAPGDYPERYPRYVLAGSGVVELAPSACPASAEPSAAGPLVTSTQVTQPAAVARTLT